MESHSMEDSKEKILADALMAEHANAAAVAAESAEKARAAQVREIMQESDERMERIMTRSLKEVFGPEDSGKFANIVRIPLICQDIALIKSNMVTVQKDVDSISGNITWGVRIVIGAIILASLALIFKA